MTQGIVVLCVYLVILLGFRMIYVRVRAKHCEKVMPNKVRIIIFCGLSAILLAMLSLLPLGRNIIRFDTPEAAFRYTHSYNYQIISIVETDCCAFVISQNGDETEIGYVNRSGEKWLYQPHYTTYNDTNSWYADGVVIVQTQDKECGEQLILVFALGGEVLTVEDSENNHFQRTDYRATSSAYARHYYYTSEKTDIENYQIIIDGVPYRLSHRLRLSRYLP